MIEFELSMEEIQFLFDWFKSSVVNGSRIDVRTSPREQVDMFYNIIQKSGIES
jgi:hypothetical protein